MLKNKEPQSDYEHLTEEEWAETVRRHVGQLDRVVTEAMRTAIRDYVVTVFAGANRDENSDLRPTRWHLRDAFAERFSGSAFGLSEPPVLISGCGRMRGGRCIHGRSFEA